MKRGSQSSLKNQGAVVWFKKEDGVRCGRVFLCETQSSAEAPTELARCCQAVRRGVPLWAVLVLFPCQKYADTSAQHDRSSNPPHRFELPRDYELPHYFFA